MGVLKSLSAKLSPPSIGQALGLGTKSRTANFLEPWGLVRRNWQRGGSLNTHDVLDPGGLAAPTIKQKRVAKAALAAPLLAADADVAYRRQRQRASALSTGAGPSGTAATTSAMAYGLPTLGG